MGSSEDARTAGAGSGVAVRALAHELRDEILRIGRDFGLHTVPSLTVWMWLNRLDAVLQAADAVDPSVADPGKTFTRVKAS